MKRMKIASLLTLAASLLTLAALADPLPAPPNTQQPNMALLHRVRCRAAVYAAGPMALNAPRMQPISEAEFLRRFAAAGECVGLDAQSEYVLSGARTANLVGGSNGTPSGVAVGLPTPAAVPTIAPPPPPVAPTAVSGVTLQQQPITFVMQTTDAGTTAVAVDASTVTTTTTVTDASTTAVSHAGRCPHGHNCGHGG